jgi:glyoxylase-like metal-dependent hydrolase (beta-lactamase superfamily II)
MGLYLKQLLAGRDFARTDSFAGQMANFVYLIGDDQARECVVVDPAWDIDGILESVAHDGYKLTGALVTHYHPDHIGGDLFGRDVRGLGELMAKNPVKVHVNRLEAEGVKAVTGLSDADLERHDGGDDVAVGEINVKLLHTPGHTPGSQCFLTESAVVSGDTLFIGGCGRVDLPGGDPEQMYFSLTRVLARLPDSTILYPGHDYSDRPVSTIGDEKANNYYLRVPSAEAWMQLMGRG